jgi:hypothetical protein
MGLLELTTYSVTNLPGRTHNSGCVRDLYYAVPGLQVTRHGRGSNANHQGMIDIPATVNPHHICIFASYVSKFIGDCTKSPGGFYPAFKYRLDRCLTVTLPV